MIEPLKDKVSLKLFAGFLITSEIRMHLNDSAIWKRSSFQNKEEFPLIEIHFHHQDYIGFFLSENHSPLEQLRQVELLLRKLLAHYCSALSTDLLPMTLFSQVFIG
jgi:hypothetical protein